MAGNVWEWTSSGDPKNLVKVVRGGSWHDEPKNLRSATVNVVEPAVRWAIVGGFRCAQ